MSTRHGKGEERPSLLQRESRGGDVAEGGLSFQDSVMMSYLPTWLAHEGFEGMTRESMGDIEAKFFVPGRERARELIEVKNHRIAPAEFWEEVGRFRDLDEGSPDTFHRFVLVGKELGEDVKRLKNGLERVRHPHSFYAGTPIEATSYAKYAEMVVGMRRSEDDARFLFERVEIRDDLTTDEAQWREVFKGELISHFPEYEDLSGRMLRDVYEGLGDLLKFRRNRIVTRTEIEGKIHERIPASNRPSLRPVVLRTAIEEEGSDEEKPNVCPIRFDWQAFFGGAGRSYPPPKEWDERLLEELRQAKAWILQHRTTRRIRLTGNRRLSTSLAIGAVFSAVSGFSIEMEYRGGEIWSTDAYPVAGTLDYSLVPSGELARSERLAVSVGIPRDISPEVEEALDNLNLTDSPVLHLTSNAPLVSAEHANVAAGAIKDRIRDALSTTGSNQVDLFFAGPAPLALFLGHRLNATARVRCYEHISLGHYVPTCELL